MAALTVVLLLAQSAAVPAPTGQLVLGETSIRAGRSVPALLVVSAPDTVASLPYDAIVAALPGGLIWLRAVDEGCTDRPPPDARAAIELSGSVHGDTLIALCVQRRDDGPLRLAATLSTLQGDGTWRTRTVVSEPASQGEPFLSSAVVLGFISSVLAFFSGLFANRIQLRAQQKGEREKKKMELEETRATEKEARLDAERARRLELETRIFDRVTAELQDNARRLRAYLASPLQAGEKEVPMELAGLDVLLKDPEMSALLGAGDRAPHLARVRKAYEMMGRYNHLVRNEPGAPARRQHAADLKQALDAALAA
ncbi:MAG TPA: hypothetical protein VGO40_08120 [Longimicrobium sp.]|nr:hypothetical protein [Longimicrobium sp.]